MLTASAHPLQAACTMATGMYSKRSAATLPPADILLSEIKEDDDLYSTIDNEDANDEKKSTAQLKCGYMPQHPTDIKNWVTRRARLPPPVPDGRRPPLPLPTECAPRLPTYCDRQTSLPQPTENSTSGNITSQHYNNTLYKLTVPLTGWRLTLTRRRIIISTVTFAVLVVLSVSLTLTLVLTRRPSDRPNLTTASPKRAPGGFAACLGSAQQGWNITTNNRNIVFDKRDIIGNITYNADDASFVVSSEGLYWIHFSVTLPINQKTAGLSATFTIHVDSVQQLSLTVTSDAHHKVKTLSRNVILDIGYDNRVYVTSSLVDQHISKPNVNLVMFKIDKFRHSTVAFKVYNASGNTAYKWPAESAEFHKVLLNVGNGWERSDSIFNAPHSGVYVFSINAKILQAEYSSVATRVVLSFSCQNHFAIFDNTGSDSHDNIAFTYEADVLSGMTVRFLRQGELAWIQPIEGKTFLKEIELCGFLYRVNAISAVKKIGISWSVVIPEAVKPPPTTTPPPFGSVVQYLAARLSGRTDSPPNECFTIYKKQVEDTFHDYSLSGQNQHTLGLWNNVSKIVMIQTAGLYYVYIDLRSEDSSSCAVEVLDQRNNIVVFAWHDDVERSDAHAKMSLSRGSATLYRLNPSDTLRVNFVSQRRSYYHVARFSGFLIYPIDSY